jgi:iron complex outermembrane receptor protein
MKSGVTTMNRLLAGASVLALTAYAGVVHAAEAAVAAADTGATVTEVIVTGTRQVGVKAADSAAPIQLIGSQQLLKTGSPDLAQSLQASVPSLNIQANGFDSAAVEILAALRGLGPNDTLVLVDGKRRHTTSNLAVDTGSPYSGSASTDLSFIPIAAIDHVEVLTDGAAAQYGTDAIAGVVNIILKKTDHGGVLSASGGQYYSGQGAQGSVSLFHGFSLGNKGFVNITLEERYHDFSVVGIGDNRVTNPDGTARTDLSFPDSGAVTSRSFPYVNKLNGDPQFNLYNAFVNAGYNVNDDIEVYGFGNYSYRSAQHYENFRMPSKLQGVASDGETVVYPFPNGFDPREKFDEKDYSITGGIRGTTAGWRWDLSSTYGDNNTQVYVTNSANAEQFPLLQALSPTPIVPQTSFYDGAFDATQWNTQLDIANSFAVGLASPVNIAFGGEVRRETFEITAGEPSSYFGAGAQSFIGYTPLDQGAYHRTSGGGYLDLAVDPISGLHIDIAGRYESYSDFGDTEVGKVTARYDFNPMIAIRGTISTGFRAPTLAEEHYSGTNVAPTFAVVVLPANSLPAQVAGFQPLKPEKSDNYSVGVVLHPLPRLQITADYYEISIRDRILESGNIYGTCCAPGPNGEDAPLISQGVLDAIAAKGANPGHGLSYTAIALFSNAANTRTEGVEVTASYASDFGDFGHVDWSVGFNYNKTEITKVQPLPAQVFSPAGNTSFLDNFASTALTTATPREKVILQANWTWQKFAVNLRETIYGPTSQYTPSDKFLLKIGATGITDLDVSYNLTSNLKIAVGANNLFDQIPPRYANDPNNSNRPVNGGHVFNVPYNFAPWGQNGGYYYGRVTVAF